MPRIFSWPDSAARHAPAMRFPLLRPALVIAVTCALTAALFAQRYNSMSAQELQRRLERDTDQLINSLRSQRSSSGSRSVPAGPSSWELQLRERERRERENRAEQARLDAEWRRDHPNETRRQYFDRIERETAATEAEERRQRQEAAAARRAQRERHAAELARQDASDWARVRASHDGYAAEVRPPGFSSPTESLAWFLRHNRETQNEWAANQAAAILMEGAGTPQDIPAALRLLDPNGPTAKKAGRRHPETRALFAYLQLTRPDAVKAAGLEADPARARDDLEAAAEKSDLGKWYLARFLNNSAAPADQKRALRLIAPGRAWANTYFAGLINVNRAALDPVSEYINSITRSIVEKQRAHLPTLIRELPMAEFKKFDDLVLYGAEPQRIEAMTLYVEAIAERAVPLTPLEKFNYQAFDYVLEKAGEAGIETVDGLAALHRFHLLGIDDLGPFQLSWNENRDAARTLAALTRWAARDDTLGTRARLALEGLAIQAASPRRWTPPLLDEVALYQSAARESGTEKIPAHPRALAAFARRDANAPKIDAVPALLASIAASAQGRESREQLAPFAAGQPIFPATFAVTDATFDLAKAAAHFDEAFAPGTKPALRRQKLFEALRLGDAFAPAVIAAEVQETSAASSPSLEPLRHLSASRRARDVAAKNPRALLFRALDARLRKEDFALLLAEAADAGSVVAARLLVAHRIEQSMSHEPERPPSWELPAPRIAELDASIAVWDTPAFSTEWLFVSNVLNFDDLNAARNWFHPAGIWEGDRIDRLADAELVRAVQPQVDAVLATLTAWPGIDHQDPRHTKLLDQASRFRAAADDLAPTDGLESLRLFLQAAISGDRSALGMLAHHIRLGAGDLPRSHELASALAVAELKMIQADAEVGDSAAAGQMAEHFLKNSDGADHLAIGLAWLRYAAELGELTAATALRDRALAAPADPAAARHWTVVIEAIENLEHLPTSPRRPPADLAPLAPVRAELETILAAAEQTLTHAATAEAQRDALNRLNDDAYERLKENPAAGLLLLAKAAAAGSREAAFTAAQILVTGRHGVEPDPALARRLHAVAVKQLQTDAEYGDAFAAYHVGLYALELPAVPPDSAVGIRWLAYAAELGESAAAEFLAQLYITGAPGVAPDAKQAARWTAFAEKTNNDNFQPRSPLRK